MKSLTLNCAPSLGKNETHESLNRIVKQAVAKIPEGERLYKLPQVLSIVPMSRAKFLKLVNEGNAPPPIKDGRQSFWLASEISRYVQAHIDATRETRPFSMEELVLKITNEKK